MSFKEDRKKQLMMVLIIASTLIPIYIIYLSFGQPQFGLQIFSIAYSFFIVFAWFLYYFDFFKKKPTYNGTNGKPALDN